MEWDKEKTMKLIEMLQVNASLWNPSLCDTRREKQKRREELRNIAIYFKISVADVSKKIQNLRSQYNRESAREVRANAETSSGSYISHWYAYDYVHFLKDSNKPYRIYLSEQGIDNDVSFHSDSSMCNDKDSNLTLPYKSSNNSTDTVDLDHSSCQPRDDFSVFGEYVANELCSLQGDKNQLIAKKKVLDIIFDVKMSNSEQLESCTVYSNSPKHRTNSNNSNKVITDPLNSVHIKPITVTHSTAASGMCEIIINNPSYSNSEYKVDTKDDMQ